MSKLTRAIEELARRAAQGDVKAAEGIRAYHGSPHDFDRFSTEQIGTGEGAQAYSRGLYFAEREGTAKSYRDALKGQNVSFGDGSTLPYGEHLTNVEDAIRAAHPNLNPDNIRQAAKSVVDDNLTDADVEGMGQWESVYKSGIAANKQAGTGKGRMYEVNIAATPDEFIDWDLPLDEQSESVMNALNKTDWYKYAEEGATNAAELRGDNAYGMDLVRWLEEDGAEDAAQMLKDAGIKGVQYADAQTRFGKGPKTKNYVVYDDKLIDITKKYGISVPLASAVAAGTMTPEEAQAGPVSRALVDLAKRAVAGDTDAATEIAKYGGAGRFLDQFGDPRSMDMRNLDQVPNVQQFGLDRYNPPRGRPANLDPLLTDEAAQRMEGFARRGENRGGRAWYNTQPLRDEFISELGESEGAAAFDRYMDIVAATSPRSRVDANIRRSSYLYGEDRAGRPIAGLTNDDFPPGYGHLAHLTQDASLKDLEGGRSFQSLDRPKTSSFAENLKGNQQPMTIDTHNFSAITGDNKNKKSPSGTQYKYLEDFQVEIANKLNMTPAQFQASVWMGAETGVADARPFLEVFDDVVARTAKRNGVSKQKSLTDFIRGDAPLYGLAALMTGGAIVPQDAQAGVIGAVRKNVDEVLLQGQDSARGVGSLAGASGRTFKNQLDETVARVYDNLRTQKDQYGEPVFDQLPVGKIEGATGRSGASPIARYRMPEGYAGSLDELKRASPDLIEIAPDSTGARYFSQQITSAKDANKYGASVYVYPENEYQQMRLFVTEDGSAGYALKPDGDVVSAFSAGKHKGVAQNILLHAVEQGGTKLDAFDTVLPDLYSTMGFRESGRLPWDDAQAPDEWNKAVFSAFNGGEPDVSFMAYNKDPAIPVEPQYANDYDAAMKAQDRDVKALSNNYGVGPVAAAAIAAGTMTPEEAQAGQAGMGGMGVRSAPTAEDEEAMLAAQPPAPTGGDLLRQANDEFIGGIMTEPRSYMGDIEKALLGGIMQTAGMADLAADVFSSLAAPVMSAPGAIGRYVADRYIPGVNYSAEDIARERKATEDYFNYQPRTDLGQQYGEQAAQTIGGAIGPYIPAIKKAAGDSYILGAMRKGYDYLGDKEKELAKAMLDLSPI